MPLYARHGVGYLWLIDPRERRLEAYGLARGAWRLLAAVAGDEAVAAAPFVGVVMELGRIWR